MEKVGTTTLKAAVPPDTEYAVADVFVMAAAAIVNDPVAEIEIDGEACAVDGFVTTKANAYLVPATNVSPAVIVNVSVPELKAPRAAVPETSNLRCAF